MKSIFRIISIIVAGLILIYAFLFSLTLTPAFDTSVTVATLLATTPQNNLVEQPINIDEMALKDNPEVYIQDDPASVITIYATVRRGDTSYTWDQLNNFNINAMTDFPIGSVEAIVQFGDERGPLPGEVGYNELLSDAIIEIRGTAAAQEMQKSYQINLFNSTGTWRDQSVINLNKHVNDETRFRNKLSFDLLQRIPNMISLRTQFVHLYVKDETIDPPQTKFVDYGLFTQVEQPNKRFLGSRLLDRDAQFYKARDFEFFRYEDQIRLATDPLYNEDSFSLRLEIKGNQDHSKLIQMLNDINNENISIEKTFETYFNSDNYFTWMAFNILVGNIDTRSQNFFLYSPKNANKWYFLPWDYDNAFPLQNFPDISAQKTSPWENGISNYWRTVLHKRVLKVDEYRYELDQKIDQILVLITPEDIYNLVNLYLPVVEKYTLVMPDRYYLPSDSTVSRRIASLIPDDIDTNYALYRESLEKPMPFSLRIPTIINQSTLVFNWEESYDFEDRDIVYHFAIGKDWAFEDIVFEQTLTDTTEIHIDMLPPGKYFWGVTAENEDGYTQLASDTYTDINNDDHPGLRHFYVTSEGEVVE